MAVELQRHRFTVDEYYRMAEAGILDQDSRVELIEGEIVDMPPIEPRHSGAVKRTAAVLHRRFDDVARISVQDPVRLDAHNERRPDLALLRPRGDADPSARPTLADVLLVIEVVESTVAADPFVNPPPYGSFGVAETWRVDLQSGAVYVYRQPSEHGYCLARMPRYGERIAPLAFPDHELDVAELLG